MSPTLPRRLGRYEVSGLIGVGAFASVFRARDDRLDSEVAVKVLAENHSFDPDLRERFITEGHLLRRVDSPHVVTVFDLDETEQGQPFLVLELATGGDLAARRRSAGGAAVDGAAVLGVADHVARALAALHAEQVVHRDVSPRNLLIQSLGSETTQPGLILGSDERLLLADLGLSKDMALASGLTVEAGTAGFTPPEQAGGGWVDVRADIWSASALLVWLGLGRAPDVEGRWRDDLVEQGWPRGFVTELGRGLAGDADDRHGGAELWLEALHRTVRPRGTDSLSSARPPQHEEPGRGGNARGRSGRPRRLRAWLGRGAAAAVLAVALVTGGWLLGRGTGNGVDIEQLGNGRVRATAEGAGVQVGAVGPSAARVGEVATFTAKVDGTKDYVWLAPDGVPYANQARLGVRPVSAGVATVTLVAVADDGALVVATLDVRVSEQ